MKEFTQSLRLSPSEIPNRIYGVENWSGGYFGVSEQGCLTVHPTRNPLMGVELNSLVQMLLQRKVTAPFLLRFPQILDTRIKELHEAFRNSIAEYNYGARHRGVFPMKVNQKKSVVERLMSAGHRYEYGLEVGTKAELAAALTIAMHPNALLICNGVKDRRYLEWAMQSAKVGKNPIIVLEEVSDLKKVAEVAAALDMRPALGVRVRVFSRGAGKWEESGGETSKFGINTMQLLDLLRMAADREMGRQLKMLHFHIGSQITDIRRIKNAIKEAARVYAKVCKMGFPIEYLDVGGGLGVDYDGSRTASDCSINYNMQEFANDIVYTINEICQSENVPPPTIITESGRAIVAHHSLFVTNVIRTLNPGLGGSEIDQSKVDSEVVREMMDLHKEINHKNFREYYHDALQHREELQSLFNLGYLNLQNRAQGEWLFWEICRKAIKFSRSMKERPEEFIDLENILASKYICNFSVFQSTPDSWALDQLFPIVPLTRLTEEPTVQATLCDITCDSDGQIDKFVDLRDVKQSLELHSVNHDPYYLAIFLVGAYQESLGMNHNLLGSPNEAHFLVDDAGRPHIDKVVRGASLSQVLEAVGYQSKDLLESLRQIAQRAEAQSRIATADREAFCESYEAALESYTYLED
ncbi:MAG: biosynthetic arginine decarboxylase [Acidobacteriota bacterium]|jgi:arginine decarboxylase|nr:biosynthetic arginine decarboxylase [Acidobacteriota bacterium]